MNLIAGNILDLVSLGSDAGALRCEVIANAITDSTAAK
jgi:hypothetical protein